MANIAIIIAGGVGKRMGQKIPKQFININDKPVLVYTLESFQKHPQIDAIELVCLDGWQNVAEAYARQYGITKLKWIVTGGETGQESIRNGVFNLEGKVGKDDVILVHDGVRPLIDNEVISDVIVKCQQYGNAVTSMPYNEQIFVIDDEDETKTHQYIPRETLRRVSTPQAYKFDLLDSKYHEAFEKKIGIYGSSYTNTMMVDLGVELHFAAGSDMNIKLTTPENLDFFKAYLNTNHLDQRLTMITENQEYLSELRTWSKKYQDWREFKDSSIMIAGATGMIGSCLVDAIMLLNREASLNCQIIALGRNKEKAKLRFKAYWDNEFFTFVEGDINASVNYDGHVDYILHAASNTHPLAYSKFPISTITTNVIGTNNLLNYAASHNVKRVLFLSSVEIYGENRGDVDKFTEDYLGYLDCNTLRAGYPESKRTGEALCQAYIKEKGLDIVIVRLSRSFGPTMLKSDSKALSQFIKKGIAKEDIVLKSAGTQQYSYIYSIDAVAAILFALVHGKCGEAYNVAGSNCDTTLKNLAETIAKVAGTKVVFKLPDAEEAAGYSTATKAMLDINKFSSLGFVADTQLDSALKSTMQILEEEYK